MGKVLDLADKLWTGELSTKDANPVVTFQGLEPLTDEIAFLSAFGNVVAVKTGEGLVLIDTSGHFAAPAVVESLRNWDKSPLHTAIYTHGHVDHVGGMAALENEAKAKGAPKPTVVAHEAVSARFDRYRMTAGYNATINSRQFQVPKGFWLSEYRYPDVTYRDHHTLEIGGRRFELHHDRGETDDHTWVWFPEEKMLCTGDLFIWASPNCGNPQKVQRYPREWADALAKMAELKPEMLLPGHGPPIVGTERVTRALTETRELLMTLHDQTVALMNEGAPLDRVIEEVKIPGQLLERPYLRPVYDEPAFIVRSLWRLYGGWYDGNPSHLKPAPAKALAEEVCNAAGGIGSIIERARKLSASGEHALACHMVEWAWQAAGDAERADAAEARAAVYEARIEVETSLMARSIFAGAARQARKKRDSQSG